MNREDIIRMAREAGAHDNGWEVRFVEPKYLERFAALVAAAQREACAVLADRALEEGWCPVGDLIRAMEQA